MLEPIFIAIIAVLAIVCIFLYRRTQELWDSLQQTQFSKQSLSVKYGKTSEQWLPLSERFPYPKEKFRFLGNPIDGIAFLDNKIVFCEFKTNKSQLSETQKRIRDLVEEKQVEWMEMRVEENG
ncbi:MAG: endonuclease [Candidatus Iainarchaeum archaeon]|uniref:Endonuclease n=1 Tax=Candidatus Iainarchaeum sp. TaxID=3101447 RepID=A0A7T9DK03_9ARCH|nr:MAG: endonuclease [Candidatus Diapherotrites archaeon]